MRSAVVARTMTVEGASLRVLFSKMVVQVVGMKSARDKRVPELCDKIPGSANVRVKIR